MRDKLAFLFLLVCLFVSVSPFLLLICFVPVVPIVVVFCCYFFLVLREKRTAFELSKFDGILEHSCV